MAKKLAKDPVEEIFGITPERAKELLDSLTPRERQAATLLATGAKPQDVAKEMGISPKTLHIYRAHIKMRLASRTSVDVARIVYAMKVGEHLS